MNNGQVEELVLQSLEHEMGGVQVYATALECVVNPNLKKEWTKYFAETKTHVAKLEEVCKALGIDTRKQTPGREVVRHLGAALVEAMKRALNSGKGAAAELVACECIVFAETKDHLDWELLGKCAENLDDSRGRALKAAYDEIEDQEDEHLYHTKGWCRELWIQSLGLKAVLPPPEEQRHVKTAIGAAKAEQAAEKTRSA
jgi:rubrerythrin